MEIAFHLRFFGFHMGNIFFTLGLIFLIGSVQALITGFFPEKKQKLIFRILVWIQFLAFAVQTVYYSIFNQPLQILMIFWSGQDALTHYWKETLLGILRAVPMLFVLALPIVLLEVLRRKKKWTTVSFQVIQKLQTGLVAWVSLLFCICTILIGNMLKKEFAEDYLEFFDPLTVMENMGVSAMIQRDGTYMIGNLVSDWTRKSTSTAAGEKNSSESRQAEVSSESASVETTAIESLDISSESSEELPEESSEESVEENVPDTSPNGWEIDYDLLTEKSQTNKETKWLADYIAAQIPTNKNEYTGLFEGYNLIFLTAEGFSTYAMTEELTPTLYKMAHSSFVFSNYYVPLWQTSTSDGEYVNCTGLIPDGQHSMRKSSEKNMAYTLAKFFGKEGVYCRAYHNNSLSYYSRHLSHPNLGYDFKASKLGELSEAEWGDHIFYMDEPNLWPASDYDMLKNSLPDYIEDERFHVYYMTVSGHLNYSFTGNRMSKRNQEAVQDLDMSDTAKAYIACNIELDKAMEYLLEQLEEAGKLENTVIVLSADHYPYGMDQDVYAELAAKVGGREDITKDMDLYRNTLILWNAGIEEPVMVDKASCSVDLLPTILNLFGFDFDSRMYAGRDIFSDEEGLVIFNDQSFVSDTVAFNKKQKTTTWLKELSAEEQDTYMTDKKADVKNRYLFSAYVLRNDYYDIISQCVIE